MIYLHDLIRGMGAACLREISGVQWSVVIGASLVAAVLDLRSRRIPNWLTLPVAASGLLLALWQDGLPGLGWAVAGCLLLILPFFVLFALGHGGAGDAKMMGAVGAWLGLDAGIMVLVAVTLTGGALALVRMIADRQRRRHFGNLAAMLYVWMIGVCSGRRGLALLKSEADAVEDSVGQAPPYQTHRQDADATKNRGQSLPSTRSGDARETQGRDALATLTMPYGPAIFIGLCLAAWVAYAGAGR